MVFLRAMTSMVSMASLLASVIPMGPTTIWATAATFGRPQRAVALAPTTTTCTTTARPWVAPATTIRRAQGLSVA